MEKEILTYYSFNQYDTPLAAKHLPILQQSLSALALEQSVRLDLAIEAVLNENIDGIADEDAAIQLLVDIEYETILSDIEDIPAPALSAYDVADDSLLHDADVLFEPPVSATKIIALIDALKQKLTDHGNADLTLDTYYRYVKDIQQLENVTLKGADELLASAPDDADNVTLMTDNIRQSDENGTLLEDYAIVNAAFPLVRAFEEAHILAQNNQQTLADAFQWLRNEDDLFFGSHDLSEEQQRFIAENDLPFPEADNAHDKLLHCTAGLLLIQQDVFANIKGENLNFILPFAEAKLSASINHFSTAVALELGIINHKDDLMVEHQDQDHVELDTVFKTLNPAGKASFQNVMRSKLEQLNDRYSILENTPSTELTDLSRLRPFDGKSLG